MKSLMQRLEQTPIRRLAAATLAAAVNFASTSMSVAEETPINPGTRIGHVHLKVADLQRALDFYTGVLGFKLT